MPDVLPSCFGDHGSHAPASNASGAGGSRSTQNVITCLYMTKPAGEHKLMSITWCKGLMGQGLSVNIDYPACQHSCNVEMKPWLFWKKQGSKSLEMDGKRAEVYWDLSNAKYGGGPEPQEGFFVAIVYDHELVLLLGDMQKEAMKKFQAASAEATLLSRKEHVVGKQLYTTRAQFFESGRVHDIAIECRNGHEASPCLSVKVDKRVVVQVKQLTWKFRGNQTIQIDGAPIEVFWDVHNWLFNPHNGHAVFMFQTCKANEKPWLREVGLPSSVVCPSQACKHGDKKNMSLEASCASVLQWPSSSSFRDKEQPPSHGSFGFSFLLYAWKHE